MSDEHKDGAVAGGDAGPRSPSPDPGDERMRALVADIERVAQSYGVNESLWRPQPLGGGTATINLVEGTLVGHDAELPLPLLLPTDGGSPYFYKSFLRKGQGRRSGTFIPIPRGSTSAASAFSAMKGQGDSQLTFCACTDDGRWGCLVTGRTYCATHAAATCMEPGCMFYHAEPGAIVKSPLLTGPGTVVIGKVHSALVMATMGSSRLGRLIKSLIVKSAIQHVIEREKLANIRAMAQKMSQAAEAHSQSVALEQQAIVGLAQSVQGPSPVGPSFAQQLLLAQSSSVPMLPPPPLQPQSVAPALTTVKVEVKEVEEVEEIVRNAPPAAAQPEPPNDVLQMMAAQMAAQQQQMAAQQQQLNQLLTKLSQQGAGESKRKAKRKAKNKERKAKRVKKAAEDSSSSTSTFAGQPQAPQARSSDSDTPPRNGDKEGDGASED
jgi:hypothetical protein